MPRRAPSRQVVPQLYGTPEYAAWVESMLAEARARGHDAAGPTDLADLALSRLGRAWKIPAPRRSRPRGTNRFGEPKGD